MTQELRIGIDLGGTKIEAVGLSRGGVVARKRVPTPANDYEATLAAIATVVEAIETEVGARGSVGVGTPGAISPRSGLIKNSNNTGLNGKPLDKDLALTLGRPVRIENDANCFALSEAVDGAGKGASVVFGVIIGTGVGGGIVVDGRPISGRNRLAGEWGHNPLPWMTAEEYPGRRCYCGHDGCIETFLSGGALAHDFFERSGETAGGAEIAARAAAGDAHARDSLDAYRDRLARALAHVVNMLDPDVIVLGGGVSNIAQIYEGLERRVESYAFTDALDTRILPNVHGDAGGVRGAAWLWGGPGGA